MNLPHLQEICLVFGYFLCYNTSVMPGTAVFVPDHRDLTIQQSEKTRKDFKHGKKEKEKQWRRKSRCAVY